jgi:hypothetical protein
MLYQDLEQIEEWNEYGELKTQIGAVPADPGTPGTSATNTPSKPSLSTPPASYPTPGSATPPPKQTGSSPHIQIKDPPLREHSQQREESRITLALRQAGQEAALKAKENAKARSGMKPAAPKSEEKETTAGTPQMTTEPTVSDDPGHEFEKESDRCDAPRDTQEELKGSETRQQRSGTAVGSTADVKVENPEAVSEDNRTECENLGRLEAETHVEKVELGGKGGEVDTTTDKGEDLDEVVEDSSTAKGKVPRGSE